MNICEYATPPPPIISLATALKIRRNKQDIKAFVDGWNEAVEVIETNKSRFTVNRCTELTVIENEISSC